MSSQLQQFNDIFPAEHIEPQSISIDLYYIVATIIIVMIIIYFKVTKRVKKSDNTILEELKSLDFSSNITKDKLYKFTILAKKYTKNREDRELKSILELIYRYKYRKNSPKIDEKTLNLIKRYIKNASK